jgi:hypothetical protein
MCKLIEWPHYDQADAFRLNKVGVTQTPQKKSGTPTDAGANEFCAINTGARVPN